MPRADGCYFGFDSRRGAKWIKYIKDMEIYGTQRQVYYAMKRTEVAEAYKKAKVLYPNDCPFTIYRRIAKDVGVSDNFVKNVIENELKLDDKAD